MSGVKRICIVTPWFGRWPAWMPLFLLSCRFNPTINWLIPSDQEAPPDLPPNVMMTRQSLADYRDRIASVIGEPLVWTDGYKLCDCKPLLGAVHERELEGFDYWGFGDIDVVYGDVRAFLPEYALNYDTISAHDDCLSGHLCLVANTPQLREAYRRIWCWRSAISDAGPRSFDETHFTRLFLPRGRMRWRDRIRYPHISAGYYAEQFSTDLRPRRWIDGTSVYPKVWTWDRGRLTTDKSGVLEFQYCHFTNWNSGRWTPDGRAPWSTLKSIMNVPLTPSPDRFTISAQGFGPA